jgi:hypothetical protein
VLLEELIEKTVMKDMKNVYLQEKNWENLKIDLAVYMEKK